MYKMDLALNNLQCNKTKPNKYFLRDAILLDIKCFPRFNKFEYQIW